MVNTTARCLGVAILHSAALTAPIYISGNDSQRIAKQTVVSRLQAGYRRDRESVGPFAGAPVLAHGSPHKRL